MKFNVDPLVTTGTVQSLPQDRPDMPIITSRPLMAVGHILAIDTKTSSMTLKIDRGRSAFPRRFELTAKRLDRWEEMLEQEFPAIRSYKLTPITMYVNATGSEPRRQLAASEGNLPHDKQLLTPSSFHPGDWVGVLYRMIPDPADPPSVINLSRLDPRRIEYQLDFNPVGHIITYSTTHTLPRIDPTADNGFSTTETRTLRQHTHRQ